MAILKKHEILSGLQQRIAREGDCHIHVTPDEMRVIISALGLERWEVDPCEREIDAVALEALVVCAKRASAPAGGHGWIK